MFADMDHERCKRKHRDLVPGRQVFWRPSSVQYQILSEEVMKKLIMTMIKMVVKRVEARGVPRATPARACKLWPPKPICMSNSKK
jgi:hypothetical protein